MTDKISDLIIDEILESAKPYTEDENFTPVSSEEVDNLIAEIMGETPEEIKKPVIPKDVTEPKNSRKKKITLDIKKIGAVKDSFDDANGTLSDNDDSEQKSIGVTANDNGQLGITTDGTLINESDETVVIEDDGEDDGNDELRSVSGQISIEKTRMFNEVKIRGEYNPKISHNLGNKVARTTTGEAEPLSTPSMSEEKYRKHFMNRPVQKIERTQEHRKLSESAPQKTIETPGVIVKKNGEASDNTDGIQPMPTLISASYELERDKKRSVMPKLNKESIVAENQIVLEGFDDTDEPVDTQTEEQIEEQLSINRKKKVDDFINNDLIFKQEVEESAAKNRYERKKINVAREFFGPKDKSAIGKIFQTEKAKLTAKVISLSIICFVMAVLSVVAGLQNGNFELYSNNESVYLAVQSALLVCCCGICFKNFKNAVISVKEKTADMNVLVAVCALAGISQCIAGFGFTDHIEATAHILASASVIPMVLQAAGELLRCKNDMENFSLVSENTDAICSVKNIEDEDTANEIARGLMLGDPEIKYSAEIGFPARFIEISRSTEVTGPLLKAALPFVAGVSLILGIVYGIISKNVFSAVSAFTGCILMGMPCAAGLVSALNLSVANKKLRSHGAVINGYGAVEDAVNSNGVIIDACDAFKYGGCNVLGVKTYHKMRLDEAIVYTASVVIASGGVLADAFRGILEYRKDLLLPVESLAYEEKLGCSCWIHNHRVLVGNRDLLTHHNVEIPNKELEEKYKAMGYNVIYLAIEGVIASMFIVVYGADEETAKYMRKLDKDGITIFFRTSDANITEEFLENEFGLPKDVVKIINPVAGEMFTRIKNDIPERSDANILYIGSFRAMFMALHSAFEINASVNISRIIQLVSAFIGVAMVVLLTFVSGLSQIGVLQIIIYQAVWTMALSFVPFLKNHKLRR